MPEYVIQPGDDFYRLSQRLGGSCEDWLQANQSINPLMLQIGQKVVLPEFKTTNAREQYAEISVDQGNQYAGEKMDDVEMEIEGVRFRVKRIGESKVPHEVHLIVPRTEIRKIQPQGEQGPCEVQIMISNIDIVHSPRLMSEGGGKTATTGTSGTSGASGTSGVAGTGASATQASMTPASGQSPNVSGVTTQGTVTGQRASQQVQYGEQSRPPQNPLARTQELGFDIRQMRPILFRK